jgi:hypothetical protein
VYAVLKNPGDPAACAAAAAKVVPANPANNAIINEIRTFCHELMKTSFTNESLLRGVVSPAPRTVRHPCQEAQLLRNQPVMGSAPDGTAA